MKKKVVVGLRILLGLMFTVFGLNGFLQFMPMPPMGATAAAYMGGLAATGYFFPVLKGTEVLVGLALLSGKFVPLALVVLAPIALHIFLFHALIEVGAQPTGTAVFILAAGVYLAYCYRDAYKGVLKADAKPKP